MTKLKQKKTEVEGYIYIMFNEMFKYYGDDVFKIGKTTDVGKRLNQYTTGYLQPPEVKFISEKCFNYTLCEKLVFEKLELFRMRVNREFFKGDLKIFIQVIDDIVISVNNGDRKQILNDIIRRRKVIKDTSRDDRVAEQEQNKSNIINDILQTLGFNMNCNDQWISLQEWRRGVEALYEEANVLHDIEHVIKLFKLTPSSISRLTESHKARMELVRSILKTRDIHVKSSKRTIRNVSTYTYTLIFSEPLEEHHDGNSGDDS